MLSGKTAVITGGSSGIGFATAQEYLKEGAKVIITGRKKEKLNKALSALNAGSNASAIQLDVCELDRFKLLEAAVQKEFDGKLDVLFANAGLALFAPLDMVDQQHYDLQFNSNVRGVLFTVKSMSPFMQKGGSIILNASAVTLKANPMGVVYYATKAAVRSMSRSFAADFGPKGIRVNSLSPGIVPDTDIGNVLPDEAFDGFVKQISAAATLRRPGKPVEIAKAAVFLASEQSSYMAASDLVVVGGWRDL